MSDFQIYIKNDEELPEESIYVSTLSETHRLIQTIDTFDVKDALESRQNILIV